MQTFREYLAETDGEDISPDAYRTKDVIQLDAAAERYLQTKPGWGWKRASLWTTPLTNATLLSIKKGQLRYSIKYNSPRSTENGMVRRVYTLIGRIENMPVRLTAENINGILDQFVDMVNKYETELKAKYTTSQEV